MWTCPTCGRSFKNTNQSHYCQKPETVDDYIAQQPPERRAYLLRIREIIAAAIPQARECISWSMPTFRDRRNVIQFAASQNHVGLYPGPEAVAFFAVELKDFKTSKGTIQLPYAKPLPENLIAAIARWCWDNRE
ncbi:MAG: DUF1801 domain-containing protein [Eubacteriales bacterium]|nr:DUF1801 domain-containing protein [Eubacteriales bacterium]